VVPSAPGGPVGGRGNEEPEEHNVVRVILLGTGDPLNQERRRLAWPFPLEGDETMHYLRLQRHCTVWAA
jgi:hypothetical protein